MRRQLLSGLSALALSLLPLAAGTATLTLAGPDAAYAGGGNGGGNGNGRGNGRGNGGGERSSERGNGHGNGQGADDDEEDEARGNGRGAIASELKGLNACHASDRAFENASEGSQVGRVAAYQAAVGAAEAIGQAEEDRDAFADNYPGRTSVAIQADIDAALLADPAADVSALTNELGAATAFENELAEYEQKVTEAKAAAEGLEEDAEEALLAASNGRPLSDDAREALAACLEG